MTWLLPLAAATLTIFLPLLLMSLTGGRGLMLGRPHLTKKETPR